MSLSLGCVQQSLTFKGKVTNSLKFKEKTTELDTRSYKCLLLSLVKLIHADPKLMLHVSPPQRPPPSPPPTVTCFQFECAFVPVRTR